MDIWGEGHPDVTKTVPLHATHVPTNVHSPTGAVLLMPPTHRLLSRKCKQPFPCLSAQLWSLLGFDLSPVSPCPWRTWSHM